MSNIGLPEPSESAESFGESLQRVASELITALDLEHQADDAGLSVRELVIQFDGDETTSLETRLAYDALESTLGALDELGLAATEVAAYCVEVDPPSRYFRLGDVETCSHRPDHPRTVR